MNKEVYLKNIADNLGILSHQVEIRNTINLFDINIVSEDFYPGLLNIIYESEYINVNTIKKNAAGIDLVDLKNRKAIQVTSDSSSEKIKHTINEFILNESYEKYDKLKILILTRKKKYTTHFETSGKFEFDKETDVFDVNDLMVDIRSLETSKLKELNEYLQMELWDKYDKATRSEASEVDTIIDLIEFISLNKAVAVPKDVVVDPDFKINRRFKEFADMITSQYSDLLLIYNKALCEIESEKGDEAQDIITRIYLQDISVKFLEDSDNNPLKALENLTNFFNEKLSINGKKYDRAAIKFYLIDKMIKCSVFPNERRDYNVS